MSERELFTVSLTGLGDAGWLVEATGTEDAAAIVRGTVPDVHDCTRGEFLVWNASYYRSCSLLGGDFGPEWTRLDDAVSLATVVTDAALADAGVFDVGGSDPEDGRQ